MTCGDRLSAAIKKDLTVRLNNDLNDSDFNEREREISLGTSTILGIFFALALVCAAFFGFGYSLGRHSSQATVPVAAPEVKKGPDTTFSNFKTAPAESATPAETSDSGPVDTPTPVADKPRASAARPAAATVIAQSHLASFPPPHTVAPAPAPASATGQFLVQVSATSRQGDAESLIASLKRKGYSATIRSESQDKLYHVQIGPFAIKKDADAMRLRLDTDGYKAIVK